MFVPQKHLYLWYNARLCALCEYSCRSREQSPQSFIFFTAFTLGRVLQSCSSFSLSLSASLSTAEYLSVSACHFFFFCLSVHLLFVLWHRCAGNCGKIYFSSPVHCGGWSLQKINGRLVFVTFAQWNLPLLYFHLHKIKNVQAAFGAFFFVILQVVFSSFYSFWSCIDLYKPCAFTNR